MPSTQPCGAPPHSLFLSFSVSLALFLSPPFSPPCALARSQGLEDDEEPAESVLQDAKDDNVNRQPGVRAPVTATRGA
jgi:hypothetical protein